MEPFRVSIAYLVHSYYNVLSSCYSKPNPCTTVNTHRRKHGPMVRFITLQIFYS